MNSKQVYNEADRFIHERLYARARKVADDTHPLWEPTRTGCVGWFWPNHELTTPDGGKINGVVIADFSKPAGTTLANRIAQAVQLTSAFGFVIAQATRNGLAIRFETRCGSAMWKSIAYRSADVCLLGPATEYRDEPLYEILWRPITA